MIFTILPRVYDWKKYWILPLVVFTLIFFFNHPLLVKNYLKLFFQIVGSYLKSMNVNQAWLSKSIGKYYSWLWYHSKNIEFITRGLWPLVINSIFFFVITITTRNIFQYFLTAMHDSTNQNNCVICHTSAGSHLTADWENVTPGQFVAASAAHGWCSEVQEM